MGDSLDCPNLFGIRIGCDVSRTKTRTNLGMVSELSLILVNNGVRSVTAGKEPASWRRNSSTTFRHNVWKMSRLVKGQQNKKVIKMNKDKIIEKTGTVCTDIALFGISSPCKRYPFGKLTMFSTNIDTLRTVSTQGKFYPSRTRGWFRGE